MTSSGNWLKNDIERRVIVREKKWEKGMAVFYKSFTPANVHLFEQEQKAEAQAWIEGK